MVSRTEQFILENIVLLTLVFLAFFGFWYLTTPKSILCDTKQSECTPPKDAWIEGLFAFNNIPMTEDGKIAIPAKKRKIKVDAGNSVNAPNSALWFDKDPDTIVFGFEPNPYSSAVLFSGQASKMYDFANVLNERHFYKDFYQMKVAVGDENKPSNTFYMTMGDPGTSSLNKPISFEIAKKVHVPMIRLDYFLSKIPWERFDYIDMIKTDTQGHDLKALIGAGVYLKERVVCVSCEFFVEGYQHVHSMEMLQEYLVLQNFEKLDGDTWVNKKWKHLVEQGEVDCTVEGL